MNKVLSALVLVLAVGFVARVALAENVLTKVIRTKSDTVQPTPVPVTGVISVAQPVFSACMVSAVNYTAQLGANIWTGALNHKPVMGEEAYAALNVYYNGAVTSVPSLDGTFEVPGKALDCSKVNPQVFIKATVPGYSDYASDPWSKALVISAVGSSPSKCVYSYSIPTTTLKAMFGEASKKHADPADQHNFAVVMKTSDVCQGWDNRYSIEVNENSTVASGMTVSNSSWNPDFGEP